MRPTRVRSHVVIATSPRENRSPMESFPAIVATENAVPASLQQVPESSLPDGDVTVDVHWSSLNYKDGLAVTGKGRIVRSFPLVCGIDLAGTVRSSETGDW